MLLVIGVNIVVPQICLAMCDEDTGANMTSSTAPFNNNADGIFNLFVALTTANHPDVWMEMYHSVTCSFPACRSLNYVCNSALVLHVDNDFVHAHNEHLFTQYISCTHFDGVRQGPPHPRSMHLPAPIGI